MRAVALALLLAPSVALGQVPKTSGGGGGVATTDLDTSSELAGILGDETGSGAACFATNPTLTGATMAGNISMATHAISFGSAPATSGDVNFENNTGFCTEASPASTDVCWFVDAAENLTLTGGASNGIDLNGKILYLSADADDYINANAEDDIRLSIDFSPVWEGIAGAFAVSARLIIRETTLTPAGGATALAVTKSSHDVDCDAGGNTIATITGGQADQILILRFLDASCTITDTGTDASNTVNLSAAFTSSDDDTMTLQYDGTSWRELARSVN